MILLIEYLDNPEYEDIKPGKELINKNHKT
jgi:hypothetical protein